MNINDYAGNLRYYMQFFTIAKFLKKKKIIKNGLVVPNILDSSNVNRRTNSILLKGLRSYECCNVGSAKRSETGWTMSVVSKVNRINSSRYTVRRHILGEVVRKSAEFIKFNIEIKHEGFFGESDNIYIALDEERQREKRIILSSLVSRGIRDRKAYIDRLMNKYEISFFSSLPSPTAGNRDRILGAVSNVIVAYNSSNSENECKEKFINNSHTMSCSFIDERLESMDSGKYSIGGTTRRNLDRFGVSIINAISYKNNTDVSHSFSGTLKPELIDFINEDWEMKDGYFNEDGVKVLLEANENIAYNNIVPSSYGLNGSGHGLRGSFRSEDMDYIFNNSRNQYYIPVLVPARTTGDGRRIVMSRLFPFRSSYVFFICRDGFTKGEELLGGVKEFVSEIHNVVLRYF